MLGTGLVLLYFGAEWLVAGASALALSLGISPLVVGLTVVAYGTSAPEMVVGIHAASGGHPDVALGNVIGSNISNIGLIFGGATLFAPARIDGALARRELPVMWFAACVVPLILLDGRVGRGESLGLLAVALGYSAWMVRSAKSRGQRLEAERSAAGIGGAAARASGVGRGSTFRNAALSVVGLGLLIIGGHVLVDGATDIARSFGMSERVLGLTVVAIGTSLPELATSFIAAYRGQSDIAVGNVIGSNIFNILVCLPAAALAGPVGVPLANVSGDVVALVGLTTAAAWYVRTQRTVSRLEGATLCAAYFAYTVYVIIG